MTIDTNTLRMAARAHADLEQDATSQLLADAADTIDAQGAQIARLRESVTQLNGLADRAYCQYIEKMRSTECLGWEQKVHSKKFGEAELKAHTSAGEFLGRHRAFHEAYTSLKAALPGENNV